MMIIDGSYLMIFGVPAILLCVEFIRTIQDQQRRAKAALILVALIMAVPLLVTTDSMTGDYVMASLAVTTILKVLDLFVGYHKEPLDLNALTTYQMIVLMFAYPKEDCLREWLWAQSKRARPTQTGRGVLMQGRVEGAKRMLAAVWFLMLMNLLLLVLPKHSSHAYETWPLFSWDFFSLLFLCSVGGYAFLSFQYCLTEGMLGLISGMRMKDIFDYPFYPTTLRDFWSRRWNLAFKDHFYAIVFGLLFHRVSQSSDDQDKNGRKRRAVLAAMATFLFSGILHEYMTYVAFNRKLTLENFSFFVAHGLLTATQQQLSTKTSRLLGAEVDRYLMKVVTFCVLVWSNVLFQGPYLRHDFYTAFQLPYLHNEAQCLK